MGFLSLGLIVIGTCSAVLWYSISQSPDFLFGFITVFAITSTMIGLLLFLYARFKRYTAPMVLEARLKKLPKIDCSSFWLTVSDEVADEATTCIICLHSFSEDGDRCDFGRARCCGNLFHRNCVQTYFNFTGRVSCPICRKSTNDVSIIDTTSV